MRTDIAFRFRLEAHDLASVRASRLAPWIGEAPHAGWTQIVLRRSERQESDLRQTLEDLNIPFQVLERRRFGDQEIETATALRLAPTASSLDLRARYDLAAACARCFRGRQQIGELVLPFGTELAPGLSFTEQGQMLVDEGTARAMIRESITGCILRGVRDARGEPSAWFQVLATETLPPLCSPPARLTRDLDQTCAACGGGGISVPSMLYYDVANDGLADLNLGREEVGSGTLAHAEVVVSQRLFRLFLQHGDATPTVEPVVLV